jgi:thiopurine S-methyltransferase
VSSTSDEWAQRYVALDTPWDLGAEHPEIAARIAGGLRPASPSVARALVPGCGRGHDAVALARAGWRVSAVDFTDATQGALQDRLAELGGEFVLQDALEPVAGVRFDLVLDHTFFCALNPALRARWGAAMALSLAPQGRVCALVYPVGKPIEDGGPPFGTSVDDLLAALGADFRVLSDEAATQRVPQRSFEERWAVFARKSAR